ncbi:MAG: triose-phosphate isomerase [Candidatus Parcubacteria bacterium]|nr:triose-phosphate isomerase [Candidatus Parcubacteria bacterium]
MPKLLIFNWKAKVLNQTEVSNLILEYQKFKTPIVVAPPYVFLTTIKDFDLSSQDVSASKPGAFTGEVTAEM